MAKALIRSSQEVRKGLLYRWSSNNIAMCIILYIEAYLQSSQIYPLQLPYYTSTHTAVIFRRNSPSLSPSLLLSLTHISLPLALSLLPYIPLWISSHSFPTVILLRYSSVIDFKNNSIVFTIIHMA